MKFNKELLRDDINARRMDKTKQVSVARISRASGVCTNSINILLNQNKEVTMRTFVKLCNYLKTPPERYFKTNE